MQVGRRLTDAELASAALDIEEPLSTERLSRERPDADLTPTILGEYHRPKTEAQIWCCHCQAHRHWNGFVIENDTGSRYLIGSHCGPKHYHLSFAAAQRQHKDLKQRQGLNRRLHQLLRVKDDLLAAIDAILKSEGLRRIDQVRAAIKRAAGDMFVRLQPIALTGGALTEAVRVRDYAAEARRPDTKPGEDSPIYTVENQRIGTLDGVGLLLENGDCRDELMALRRAIGDVRKINELGTDSATTSSLQKVVTQAEEAHHKAQQAIELARRAPAFFSQENLIRLERWSSQFTSFEVRRIEDGLGVIPRDGAMVRILAVRDIELLDLPPLEPAQ